MENDESVTKPGRQWTTKANTILGNRLGVAIGTPIDVEEALVFHADRPLGLRVRYAVPGTFPAANDDDLAADTKVRVENAGYELGAVLSTYESVACDAQSAAALECDMSQPLLLQRSLYLAADSTPLVLNVFRMRGDVAVVHTALNTPTN